MDSPSSSESEDVVKLGLPEILLILVVAVLVFYFTRRRKERE